MQNKALVVIDIQNDIRLPDVLRYRLNEVLIPGAQRSGGAVCTDLWITFVFPVAVTVGCGVFQYLVFRADDVPMEGSNPKNQ